MIVSLLGTLWHHLYSHNLTGYHMCNTVLVCCGGLLLCAQTVAMAHLHSTQSQPLRTAYILSLIIAHCKIFKCMAHDLDCHVTLLYGSRHLSNSLGSLSKGQNYLETIRQHVGQDNWVIGLEHVTPLVWYQYTYIAAPSLLHILSTAIFCLAMLC